MNQKINNNQTAIQHRQKLEKQISEAKIKQLAHIRKYDELKATTQQIKNERVELIKQLKRHKKEFVIFKSEKERESNKLVHQNRLLQIEADKLLRTQKQLNKQLEKRKPSHNSKIDVLQLSAFAMDELRLGLYLAESREYLNTLYEWRAMATRELAEMCDLHDSSDETQIKQLKEAIEEVNTKYYEINRIMNTFGSFTPTERSFSANPKSTNQIRNCNRRMICCKIKNGVPINFCVT